MGSTNHIFDENGRDWRWPSSEWGNRARPAEVAKPRTAVELAHQRLMTLRTHAEKKIDAHIMPWSTLPPPPPKVRFAPAPPPDSLALLAVGALERSGLAAGAPGTAALINAARCGRRATVRSLIAVGVAVDGSSDSGSGSPLFHAAWRGEQEIVEELVENGAALEIAATAGTPLVAAASRGNYRVVCYLIEKGADIEATDAKGFTALHLSAMNGHVSVCRHLVQGCGASFERRSHDGATPFLCASQVQLEDRHQPSTQALGTTAAAGV